MKRQHVLSLALCFFASLVPHMVWATTDIFSASTAESDLIPVQLCNNRSKGYAIKMNTSTDYAGKSINSGSCGYLENELWYLVGTADSFKMYSHTAGTALALTLADDSQGSAATLTTGGTPLSLIAQGDGSYAITPKSNPTQSFNMYGGNGQDIKLYDASDSGSKWTIRAIDTSKALTIRYNAQLEGGYEQNYKIGELAITIAGTPGSILLDKHTLPGSTTCYLPEGAEFAIATGLICHGWTMNINGHASLATQVLPEDGLTVNVNIAVDKDNKYQYLYYSPSAEVILIDADADKFAEYVHKNAVGKYGILVTNEDSHYFNGENILSLGSSYDSRDASKRLFNLLRSADDMKLDLVFARLAPNTDEYMAYNNRLIRAAGCKILKLHK